MKCNFHYADFHEIRNHSLLFFIYYLNNFIKLGAEVYENVKVKVTRQQIMKAQRGSRAIALLFL